jgi:hypothetical protein
MGQGSVISPLLANVYLHYVFDLWAERWRRHEATGGMMIVRYADDIVVGFAHEADARRFWDAMRKRFEEFMRCRYIRRNSPDRVRPPSGGPARARETGDLQFPGLHPHLQTFTSGSGRKISRTLIRQRLPLVLKTTAIEQTDASIFQSA